MPTARCHAVKEEIASRLSSRRRRPEVPTFGIYNSPGRFL
jgi:hypothetical protein